MKFIPKVGETCLVKLCGMNEHEEASIKFVSDDHVIFIMNGRERCEYTKSNAFSPIKSPAEIEREDDIQALVEFLIGYYGNPKGGEHFLPLAEALIKMGYSNKQQVKSLTLSKNKFEGIWFNNNCDGGWEAIKPYTIQGGDK